MTIFTILTSKLTIFSSGWDSELQKKGDFLRISQNLPKMSLDGQSRTRDSGMTGIHENGSFIGFGRELPQYFYNLWPFYSQSLLVLEVDNKFHVTVRHWKTQILAIFVPSPPNITKNTRSRHNAVHVDHTH